MQFREPVLDVIMEQIKQAHLSAEERLALIVILCVQFLARWEPEARTLVHAGLIDALRSLTDVSPGNAAQKFADAFDAFCLPIIEEAKQTH